MAYREDPLDFVVSNFLSLEDQLLACMGYVPFIEQNASVVSPRFLPIMMEACSLIDSVFCYLTKETTRRNNLRRYAATHESQLDLENATTLFLVSPIQFLRPFKGWTNSAPLWWNAYNKIKHDRIGNYTAATYLSTVTALAGLHQVLARVWAFQGNLVKAGWFNQADERFMDLLAARCAGCGPPEMAVESRLFVSATREDFVDWTTDPPTVEAWDFTERVKSLIWEEEGW